MPTPTPGPNRGGVAVVASCMMDMVTNVTRMPALGETLRGEAFHLGFGGKGANQAVMAARAGAQVSVVARVGDDPFGAMTVDNFRAQGIGTAHVLKTAGSTTGVAPILVREDGANLIVIVSGANDRLSPADVRGAGERFAGAAVVVSQLESPQAASVEAFRLAKEGGVGITLLNPAPAARIADELLELTDILVPNEVELGQLTGRACGTLHEVASAAASLETGTAGAVVVTLGERGALVVRGGEATHVGPYEVRARDTTGAGDAFVGALAARLAAGADIGPAAEFANAAAALSTMRAGTQLSFPDLAAVDRQHRSAGGGLHRL